MARKFIDGFEGGDHDMWDTEANATVVSSADKDMDGSYCLDLNDGTEYLEKNITAIGEMYFAFIYRHTNIGYNHEVLVVYNGSTVLAHVVIATTTGLISIYRSTDTLLDTGSKVLAANTSYLFEVHISIADSGGRFEVKIDGIQDINFTGDTKPDANTQFDKVRLGYAAIGIYSSRAYFDNFIMDDAAWIGDTNIQAVVPTAGGNSTNWSPSVGANYACVDEKPPNDADYVSINANDVVDTYVAGDLSGNINNIKCVQVQSRTRTEGSPTPTNLKLVIRRSSTDYLSGNKSVPATEKGLYNLWVTDPSTSVAWLEAGVNAMEIGIKSAA